VESTGERYWDIRSSSSGGRRSRFVAAVVGGIFMNFIGILSDFHMRAANTGQLGDLARGAIGIVRF
jgi:hypothetical protein